MTVEDPIEYYLDGISQTQVNTKVEMTFARGLRAILRQDPDVVMVGEIRDLETAEIAVQASLTGHLVLSTLHTNSAVGAMTGCATWEWSRSCCRLRWSGCWPSGWCASFAPLQAAASGYADRLRSAERGSGHAADAVCSGGLRAVQPLRLPGRTGIFELVTVDETMQTLIHEGKGEQELERHARLSSSSIRDDGRRRVLAGDSALAELVRVTRED